MTRDHYEPIPFDADAAHRRWAMRPGYTEAYAALADEYGALGELLRARQAAGFAQSSIARLESSIGSRKNAPRWPHCATTPIAAA